MAELEGQDVIGLNAEINVSEVPETVDGETRTCEQRQSEREFADNQQATQLVAFRAGGGASAVFQRLLRIDARSIAGGRAAEEQPGESYCGESSGENRQVELEVGFRRQDAFRTIATTQSRKLPKATPSAPPSAARRRLSVRN